MVVLYTQFLDEATLKTTEAAYASVISNTEYHDPIGNEAKIRGPQCAQ